VVGPRTRLNVSGERKMSCLCQCWNCGLFSPWSISASVGTAVCPARGLSLPVLELRSVQPVVYLCQCWNCCLSSPWSISASVGTAVCSARGLSLPVLELRSVQPVVYLCQCWNCGLFSPWSISATKLTTITVTFHRWVGLM